MDISSSTTSTRVGSLTARIVGFEIPVGNRFT
jgi:hypothetical protein